MNYDKQIKDNKQDRLLLFQIPTLFGSIKRRIYTNIRIQKYKKQNIQKPNIQKLNTQENAKFFLCELLTSSDRHRCADHQLILTSAEIKFYIKFNNVIKENHASLYSSNFFFEVTISFCVIIIIIMHKSA